MPLAARKFATLQCTEQLLQPWARVTAARAAEPYAGCRGHRAPCALRGAGTTTSPLHVCSAEARRHVRIDHLGFDEPSPLFAQS